MAIFNSFLYVYQRVIQHFGTWQSCHTHGTSHGTQTSHMIRWPSETTHRQPADSAVARLPGDALLFCLLGCHDQPQTCIDLLCSNTVKSFKMFKNMALILLRKRLTHVDRWYNSTTRTGLVWCTADLPWAMVQKKNAPHLMWFQERNQMPKAARTWIRKIHQQSSVELLNKIETQNQKKSSISPTCLKRNTFFIHERFHSLAACVHNIFFWQTSHHITYVEETKSSVWPRRVIHVRGMYPLVN